MASKRHSFGSTLSKNLLQMKFMQKTREKSEQELDQLEAHSVANQEMADKLRKEGQFVMDSSYLYVERLVFGRMSFKGMNPEIEKLMVEMNAKTSEETNGNTEAEEESVEVSAQEMTDRYSKLMNSRNGPNGERRGRKRGRYENSNRGNRFSKFKKVKN